VVRHLEQVHLLEAACEQLRIDLLLDIAHEQKAVHSHLSGQYNGDVVDRRTTVRWLVRHPIAERPQHLE
jgi:hypothetical protein